MKVLIVEDNTSSRLLLGKILGKAGYEITYARDGLEAREILMQDNFDAVLTDWMMPNLDGIELIGLIRKMKNPAPVILVITALASRDARNKAMDAGADDYVAKPYHNQEVLDRLQTCILRKKADLNRPAVPERIEKRVPSFVGVGIAASTGGPSTLLEVITGLKPTTLASFFIVLHGPAWMLESYSERLREQTRMGVILAKDGISVKPGIIYLAPGDRHMVIDTAKFELQLLDTPPENFVRPSADPLFRSIADSFGPKSLGVVLTGMGRDGSIGSGYISAAGGIVLAQDPATAILPSMPQSVIDLRIAQHVVPLDSMADAIMNNISQLS